VGGKRKVPRAGNSADIYAPLVLRVGGLKACVKLQLQLLKIRAQSPQALYSRMDSIEGGEGKHAQ
jgi:hypothetical protein